MFIDVFRPRSGRVWLTRLLLATILACLAAPGYADFRINRDGTVTDTVTDLIWVRDTSLAGRAMSWKEALEWVNNLEFAGVDDWRLPSGTNTDGTPCVSSGPPVTNCAETELGKLWHVDSIKVSSPDPFQGIGDLNNSFWTSTKNSDDNGEAILMNMAGASALGGEGSHEYTLISFQGTAWAVRDLTWFEQFIGRQLLWIIVGFVVVVMGFYRWFTR